MNFDHPSITLQRLPRDHRTKTLIGIPCGRLTVLGYIGIKKAGRKAVWLCKCTCGTITAAAGPDLRSGHVESCGCLIGQGTRTHGQHLTYLYKIWQQMRDRCNNPNNKSFARYGGRGIAVCQRWDDYACFAADMGDRPTPQHTIERKENNGNYESDNCVWATHVIQNNNTSRNHLLTVGDITLTIAQWWLRTGIKQSTLRTRIKLGYSPEQIISPLMHRRNLIKQTAD